jgi:hypothetical protein
VRTALLLALVGFGFAFVVPVVTTYACTQDCGPATQETAFYIGVAFLIAMLVRRAAWVTLGRRRAT